MMTLSGVSDAIVSPRRVTRAVAAIALAVAAALLLPCLLYWSVPGNARPAGVLYLLSYVLVPSVLAVCLPRGRTRALGDALVVLSIWLPVELRLLSTAFPWPRGGAGTFLVSPLGLDLLLYLMLVVRGFDAT